MKFASLIAVCLIASFAVDAQIIAPGPPPIMGALGGFGGLGLGVGFPGLGLGLGLGLPFGPFGLGGLGLGLGGFGRFGLGGGLGRFGGLGGLGGLGGIGGAPFGAFGGFGGRLGGIRGKRDTEVTDFIRCTLSTQTKVLNCTGVHQKVECEVEPHMIGETKLRLVDLTFREKTENDVQFLRLVTRKSFGKFTFIDPTTHQPVLYSIYAHKHINEPGFIVKDKTCFSEIVSLVKDIPDKVKLGLVVSH